MSYLKPHNSFKNLIARFKRAQKINIVEQYEKYNVRAFDFHLYFVGSKGRAIFKYGCIEYETFSIYLKCCMTAEGGTLEPVKENERS